MSEELETQLSNQSFMEKITSEDPRLVKQAQQGVNDYTRYKMRETGFLRKILPPIPIQSSAIDRSVETDKPVKIVDRESDTPGAVTIPFATNPMGRYLRGRRYRIMFGRIITPQFAKDVEELHTYHMDLRTVVADNSIKDLLAEEDTKWIAACNSVMVGPDEVVAETNSVHWKTIPGSEDRALTRESLAESLKIMPRNPTRLEAKTALINQITVKDVLKFYHDEAGGPTIAQDMLLNGFSEQKMMGVNWIVTIKQDIVPENTIFYFAEPKFLGKFYVLDDTTMWMDKNKWMIQFCAYECIGAGIGNIGGVCRADFVATGT